MKTICLLADHQDATWIPEYWQSKSDIEDITIIAPSFEGRLIAESLKLPYKTYEEEAWKIDKNELYDTARTQSHRWHQLQEMKGNPYLEAVRHFKDYPLLVMHQSHLLLAIYEILQARDFMRRVFELEQPDKAVVGRRENPCNKSILFIVIGSNGLEREAAKGLSSNDDIEFVEMQTGSTVISTKMSVIINRIVRGLRNPRLVVHKAVSVLKRYQIEPRCQFVWHSELTGPKILIFAWGGYYLKQLSETFDLLLQHKARIGLVMIGGKLTAEEERTLRQQGVCVFQKSEWPIENEQSILSEWRDKGLDAFRSISSSEALKNYFSDGSGSYFAGLVDEAIKGELVRNIPITVTELIRSEAIISTFEPDLLVAHFAMQPWESCDVLPARLLGIPTLTLTHGVPWYTDSERDTFSTQYYAVPGDVYKDALTQSIKCTGDVVIPVGESRLENMKCQMSTREAKATFGFNPDHPLCIFCDSSGWTHTLAWRHSTFKTIEQILDLKNHIPNLQIIYRVHHGANYSQMQKYFDDLDMPDVTFQISPSPLFTEIVQAADVVISHQTSAITEALVCGVRVIYLCALSDIEPAYLNCEVIKVADKFELLPGLVKSIIENPMSREDVRTLAQPYFDRTLCGNDGKATERLAQLVIKLARTPKTEWQKGFQDWLDRIDASSEFKSGSWNTAKLFKQ